MYGPTREKLCAGGAESNGDRPLKCSPLAQKAGLDPRGDRRERSSRPPDRAQEHGIRAYPSADYDQLRIDDRAHCRNRRPKEHGDVIDYRLRRLASATCKLEHLVDRRELGILSPTALAECCDDSGCADLVL
jgi:hypothetical protein